jgi:hypothetical protein
MPHGQTGLLTIETQGELAVVLLTDSDLVERFCRDRFSGDASIVESCIRIESRSALVDTLRRIDGVRRIAFDVSGQEIVPSTTIAEFIEWLEEHLE